MAQRISDMQQAKLPLSGTELFEVVQEGRNRSIPASALFSAGSDGKSAYEVAVEKGFSGTAAQWLESLKGAEGNPGKSAYQSAVDNGFEGTETEWVESLKGTEGTEGAPGKSAYEIAVKNGYTGTESEWLASLKGEKGDTGADGADGTGGTTDGTTGGIEVPVTSISMHVNSFSAGDYTLPEGVSIEKVYSDTSIQITHGLNKFPTGWFAFNKESNPMTALLPSATRNLQIVDENTVIVTSMSGFESFFVALNF